MINMEKLIVLDFSTGQCTVYLLQPGDVVDNDYEEYMRSKLNLRVDDCQWMVSEKPIIIG